MNGAALPDFRRDFARSAEYRRDLERFMKEQERERAKKSDKEDRLDDDMADLAVTVMAGDSEIAEFTKRLDNYRTATVESLMENEEKLAEVQKRLDDMLGKAHVLPNGRRVFKTKDGLRVFDESGTELSADSVDPETIENWRPNAEEYVTDFRQKQTLLEDRERKLDFLDRMDKMEERIEEGDLTQDDLKELEDELDTFTPPDIRARVEGIEWKPPSMKGHFDAASGIVPAAIQSPARSFDQFAPS
ncbi:hypothetical protein [Shinella sp.]|uniref:hypothetical protein n=1 Tax=Shinella sp. TaxID=1870904 RepID=UPI0029A78482|nr:hypothetical protein [Shinella sp.]MDX3973491.1 hypothetical protein [Shinella sp.]